jgi:ADP-ribose pyrophosphatase
MNIHKVDKLTDERWLNLFAATYSNRGHTGRWVFASRREQPRPLAATEGGSSQADAVLIVPLLRGGEEQEPRLVMIREFRIPVGGYVYSFPAGLLEAGESVEETARREVREETGLEVVAIRRITQPLFPSSGLTDESVALAFVEVEARAEAEPRLDRSEVIEVLCLDHQEVCQLCDNTSVHVDAKAWTVLYLYQQLGRLA